MGKKKGTGKGDNKKTRAVMTKEHVHNVLMKSLSERRLSGKVMEQGGKSGWLGLLASADIRSVSPGSSGWFSWWVRIDRLISVYLQPLGSLQGNVGEPSSCCCYAAWSATRRAGECFCAGLVSHFYSNKRGERRARYMINSLIILLESTRPGLTGYSN